ILCLLSSTGTGPPAPTLTASAGLFRPSGRVDATASPPPRYGIPSAAAWGGRVGRGVPPRTPSLPAVRRASRPSCTEYVLRPIWQATASGGAAGPPRGAAWWVPPAPPGKASLAGAGAAPLEARQRGAREFSTCWAGAPRALIVFNICFSSFTLPPAPPFQEGSAESS